MKIQDKFLHDFIKQIDSEKIRKHAELWASNLEGRYRYSSGIYDNANNFIEMVFRRLAWSMEKEVLVTVTLDRIKIHVYTMFHDYAKDSNTSKVYDCEFKI
jgi:HD superfamily phosphohydrolase YqeK